MAAMADFDKAGRDLRVLMAAFREVLAELGEDAIAALLPWHPDRTGRTVTDANAGGWPEAQAERITQAYSIAFQLLHQAEENAAAQYRRQVEAEGQLGGHSGSWDVYLGHLKDLGWTGASWHRRWRGSALNRC